MFLLPPPRKKSRLRTFLASKRFRYKLAALLDLILIIVILINGRQPAQRLISPLVSSFNSFYSQTINHTTRESFAFIPGLARNKFTDVDLEGLSVLSFFDVPLTSEGEINVNSRGYSSFTSDEAAELFDKARYNKTKIFLTISAWDEDIIKNLLGNSEAQQRLADQATETIKDSNINGITIDFEMLGGRGDSYQQSFTDFIALLTTRIHNELPQAEVAVGIPSSLSNNESLYNREDLSKVSDKIFLIASDIIVPEVRQAKPVNPVYGFKEKDYWAHLSNLLGNLLKKVPANKLVMERAWYGNGNNYPLYIPSGMPRAERRQGTSTQVTLNKDTIERLVEGVPAKGKDAARKSIPLIANALEAEGILDSNVLAYALATVEHETDETFAPIDEIQGRISARRLGYEGGQNYFGRGYLQITHLRNYKTFGARIGMGDQLVENPELASNPEIAAEILAAFFKDNNVANLASQGYFVAARQPINPDYNGRSVARLAMKYELY